MNFTGLIRCYVYLAHLGQVNGELWIINANITHVCPSLETASAH